MFALIHFTEDADTLDVLDALDTDDDRVAYLAQWDCGDIEDSLMFHGGTHEEDLDPGFSTVSFRGDYALVDSRTGHYYALYRRVEDD